MATAASKTETFKATVTTAYGKPLPKNVGENGTLKINGDYPAYATVDEVRSDYSKPGEFDKFVIESANAASKASAIASARQTALDNAGIQKPKMSEDRELQIQTIVRGLVAAGRDRDEARKIAEGLVPEA